MEENTATNEKKSPLLAGALSMAVPGAGQYYARSYWEAAGFIAAEAILWIAYAIKTKEADQRTGEFQQFADAHFSVVNYATWIERYYPGINTSGLYSSDLSLLPWERINWQRLNEVEAEVGMKSNTGFSHRLLARPEQQYFELIGKYPQYGGGWDDASGWDANGPFVALDVVSDRVSPKFLAYRQMRGDANTLYNFATGTSFVILANHVLSALHAAWSTSRWNRNIDVSAHLRTISFAHQERLYVPEITVKLRF
jgi:hypothetical protein